MELDDTTVIERVARALMYGDSQEVYAVKELDRRLSRPFIKPFFATCDVGGGNGVDAIPFAYLSDSSFLLEKNKGALSIAKDAAAKLGVKSKMVFVRCSALNLPFKNEVFNLVSSFSVLDHVPGEKSHQLAIDEMARVTCNFGYVVVTVPNKLFIVGVIARKIIQLMGNPGLEKHFAPREIERTMLSVGLKPLFFDATYPTKIDKYIVSFHLPKFMMAVPAIILQPFIRICERIFSQLEKGPFRKCGARMGYTSQKIST